MNKISYIAILAITALTFCGCQNTLELDSRIEAISFNPSIDGVTNTEMTKATTFRSEDGSVEIPAWLEVSDGIAVQEIAAQVASETKGTQINTTGNSTTLATFASQIDNKFYVSAWKGSTPARFIPSSGSYAEVTYSDSKWSTITTDWDGKESATFFAYANPPASGATVSNDASTTQILTYSAVPVAASAQTDILLGYYYGTGSPNTTDKTCTATLQFHHPLTAVKFKKGEFSGTASFKAIYIDGVYKSGKATMTADGTNSTISWSDKSTTMQEVCQEGSQYLTVEDNIIGEPFLLIPQTITASAPVTVTVVAEIDGILHPLTATLDPIEWEAGKTYTYIIGKSIDTSDYTFTFENMSGGEIISLLFRNTVRTGRESFKLIESSKEGGTVPVGYSAFYSTDNGATWIAYNSATTGISGLEPTGNEGLASGGDSRTIYLTSKPRVTPSDMYFWKGRAGEPEMRGSAAAPVDLSKLPVGGEGAEGAEQHTANCYIVKHAGYYKFPCVYGNGNFQTETSGDHVLSTFVNAKGNPISSKYVLADVAASAPKAAMLWSDFMYEELNLVNDVELIGSGNSAYIRFKTPSRDELAEGNAVIVLYDDLNSNNSYDEGEALWSWHIWVSDSDLSADNVGTVDTRFGQFSFMSHNIGWCGRVNSLGTVHVDPPFNNFRIRLVQDESGKTKDIRILQYEEVDNGVVGNSSLFQYGRKDPFVSQIQGGNVDTGTTTKTKNTYHSDGTVLTSRPFAVLSTGDGSSADGISNVASMIRNPETVNTYAKGTDGWFNNLWSLCNIHCSLMAYGAPLVKTIYDPSPYGYLVANPNAFNTFTDVIVDKGGDHGSIIGSWSSGKDPIEGAIINDDNDHMFFPANGYVSFDSSSSRFYSSEFRAGFYSWTSAPGYTSKGISNIKSFEYTSNDILCAVASWGRNTAGGTEMYPLGTFSRNFMFPVRPVLEIENGERPGPGTILYRDNFNIGDNSIYSISSYDSNPKGAYTFRYFTIPNYTATTSPEGIDMNRFGIHTDSPSSTPTPNVNGAYLCFWPYDATNETYTFTVSNIKTWGAHKVRLTFSSYKSVGATSSCTSTCTINGQTKSFDSSANNSFEFTLSGAEETISIVFTNQGSGYPKTCIDDIILTFVN